MSNYKINSVVWQVKSVDSVKFHVKNDDYFGTIATILNLLDKEIIENKGDNNIKTREILDNVKKDLMFLQKNYQIKPKTKKKNRRPRGKEINQ